VIKKFERTRFTLKIESSVLNKISTVPTVGNINVGPMPFSESIKKNDAMIIDNPSQPIEEA